MNALKFTNLLDVDDKLKSKVRQWRNKERIRRFMRSQHAIEAKEHHRWVESLGQRDDQKFWVVFHGESPIGAVYLQDINYRQLNAEWGFYIGDDSYLEMGLGKKIIYMLLAYFFEEMNFKVLFTKVLSDNVIALSLYEKFKFSEINSDVFDNHRKIITFNITRNNWKRWKNDLESFCI